MIQKITQAFTAFIALLLSILSIAEAQSQNDAYSIDRFTTSASPEVSIKTSGGFINIIGHDEDYVEVQMFVRRGNQYLSQSDTDLSDFEININESDDFVTAEARMNRSGFLRATNRISISFKVYAPYTSKIEGQTSGGSVSAEHIYNSVNLRTSGGSITARNLEGDVSLQTSGGSLSLTEISGNIQAQTSGGSIRASSIEGIADLRTSGGGIRLDDISAKLSARTSGGSIRGNFSTFYDDIDLQTSGGSITIEIPATEHLDMYLRGNRVNAQLNNFSGEAERNVIKGRIGDGGPMVSARTSGGSVTLRYQ